MKPEFSRQILKKLSKYQISWKSVQLEASCHTRTDGHTDRYYEVIAFRNFACVPTQKSHDVPLCNYITQHLPDCDVRRWVAATDDSYPSSRNLAWSHLDVSCMIPPCPHPNIINFLRSRLHQRVMWRQPPSLASQCADQPHPLQTPAQAMTPLRRTYEPNPAREFHRSFSTSWLDDCCPVEDFEQWVFCRRTLNRWRRLCYDTKSGHRETGGLQKQITIEGQAQTKEVYKKESGVTFTFQFCTHGMPLCTFPFW